MIVAHEHSPVLVACVWRETKARSFYGRNLTSFALCYYVIGLFNKVQTDHKHKRKRMWFGCEQPFLWVEHCVTSQKTAAKETRENEAYYGATENKEYLLIDKQNYRYYDSVSHLIW